MKNMQIDSICGMQVDENTAQYKTEYKGKTYYFCASGCKKTFDSEPEKSQIDEHKNEELT
jgi:YHS domain-containing protein